MKMCCLPLLVGRGRRAAAVALLVGSHASLGACKGSHASPQPHDRSRTVSSTTPATESSTAATAAGSVIASAKPFIHRHRASFLAVGDIMLSRKTAAAIDAADDPLLPFRGLASTLESVDFCFGNLEAMFSSTDRYFTGPAHVFNIPKKNIAGLVKYRFQVLNLANNHALDQGLDGVKVTLKHLHQNGIKTVGLGLNTAAAWRPAVHRVRDLRFGFVGAAYSSVNDNGQRMLPYVARMHQVGRLRGAIQDLKKRSDFVVVTVHAGVEYQHRALEGQRRFARLAIDEGADMVIGHHPHVVQDVEVYRQKYIFYSLGNFVFDHQKKAAKLGAALRIEVEKFAAHSRLRRLEIVPYAIENQATPRPASPEESRRILQWMKLAQLQLVSPPADRP